MSDVSRYPRLDARAIRVLAHPLRSRLLGHLRLEGPATATTLASALGTNSGATSYHLRRLAEVGLVEDTHEGHGRERVWRPTHHAHSWFDTDFENDPDSQAAGEWLLEDHVRQFQERFDRWRRTKSDWPVQWREPAGMSDYFLDLSADQFRALTREISAVVERYRDAGPGEAAERVFLFIHAFPEHRNGAS